MLAYLNIAILLLWLGVEAVPVAADALAGLERDRVSSADDE